MSQVSEEEGARIVVAASAVDRTDVARAKAYAVEYSSRHAAFDTDPVAASWANGQGVAPSLTVVVDQTDAEERLQEIGRYYALHLAFFQGIWELVLAGELFPANLSAWRPKGITTKSSRHGSGFELPLSCARPERVTRPPLADRGFACDMDLLIAGHRLESLHAGVLEALRLCIDCLRRGLNLPAIAMLAAGAEAQWLECGRVVCASEPKVALMLDNPHVGIGKIVEAVCAHLNGAGKPARNQSRVSEGQLLEAQGWTTVLREHRNALHWGKSGSFAKTYGEVATLLLAAPIHLGALERLRSTPDQQTEPR